MATAPLKAWPSSPNPKLLPWAIWRFENKPGPSPWPIQIPQYAWEFLQWAGWRRAGANPAKRPNIIPKIPQWAWSYLKQINIAVPLKPPPPPPPPANPIPPNSWKLKMPAMYTAHGWLLDTDFRDTDNFLRQSADAGVGSIGLQGGMFLADTADRCRAYGFDVFVWGSADSRDADYIAMAKADGYVPQVEGYYEWERAVANLESGVGAGLSLSIVTTNAGLQTFIGRPDGNGGMESTTVEAERLIAAGCSHAQVECYYADMTPRSADGCERILWDTEHRGMYYVSPVMSYTGINVPTRYGRQVGVFLAEPMSDDQFRTLKAL